MTIRPIPPSSLMRLLLASGNPMQPHVLAILLQQGAVTVHDMVQPVAAPSLVDMVIGSAGCLAGQPGAVDDDAFDPAESWDRDVWLPMCSLTPHPELPHLHSTSPTDATRVYPAWTLWLMSLSGTARTRGASVLAAAFNRQKRADPRVSLDVLAPLDVVTLNDSSGGSRLFVWRVIDLLAVSLSPKNLGLLLDTLPPDRLRDLRQRQPANPSWPMLSLNWIHGGRLAQTVAPVRPYPYEGFAAYRSAYVDALTTHGWSLDLPDVTGRPPILYASSLSAARDLVQMGADPRVKTDDGQSLIDVAAAWDLRAAARVAALSEVQGWIAARSSSEQSSGGPLSPQEQQAIARQQNLKAAEALIRSAPMTSVRPVLRSLKDPLPGENPTTLLTALLRRALDERPNKGTLSLVRWLLAKDKKDGWWDFDAHLPDIPVWTVRHVLDVIFSTFPSMGGVPAAQPDWALPLSSPDPVAAFVRWSDRPFFAALPVLSQSFHRTGGNTTLGYVSGAGLIRSFSYAGPKRPLDLALAQDACVEDVAPGRPGLRARLGLMNGTARSRLGGHGRILEHWEATCDNPEFSEDVRGLWERAALMTARRIIITAGADVLSFSQELAKNESYKTYKEAITLSVVNRVHHLCSDPGVRRRNPGWFADTMLLLATPARRLSDEYLFGNLDADITAGIGRPDCSVYTTTMAQLSSNTGYDHLQVRPTIRGAIKALLDSLVLSFGIPEPPPDEESPVAASVPVLEAPRRRM